MVYLTRKAEFSASHYYHNPDFTPEENRRLFGKCNNPHGHGHNYTLEVTVKGEVDPRSGFVVDLKQLKEIMHREVLDAMDHRFLNKEVPEFFTQIPTTENLAIAMLAAPGIQTPASPPPPRSRLRNSRPLRRFLRRKMNFKLTKPGRHRERRCISGEAKNFARIRPDPRRFLSEVQRLTTNGQRLI